MAKKATHMRVSKKFLEDRNKAAEEAGYSKAKWIEFCEYMMEKGFYIKLYEARKTVSKYITVIDPDDNKRKFKVRFSNHKPIKSREVQGDCDFFVGVTNLGTTNTEDAIKATINYFHEEIPNDLDEINDNSMTHRPFEDLKKLNK